MHYHLPMLASSTLCLEQDGRRPCRAHFRCIHSRHPESLAQANNGRIKIRRARDGMWDLDFAYGEMGTT